MPSDGDLFLGASGHGLRALQRFDVSGQRQSRSLGYPALCVLINVELDICNLKIISTTAPTVLRLALLSVAQDFGVNLVAIRYAHSTKEE